MWSLSIRYLQGWSASTSTRHSAQPEWPPHPDRVFMALTAACFETGADSADRAALAWLETQDPPGLRYAPAEPRDALPVFVPVNGDRNQMKSLIRVLPERRKRDRRHFPIALLEDDTVHLVWATALDPLHRTALERLCVHVGYLGDTTSLVQLWITDDAPEPTLVPTDTAARDSLRLRVPYDGRLEDLQQIYARDVAAGEYRPRSFRYQAYVRPCVAPEPTPVSTLGELIILRRTGGARLDLRSTQELIQAWREALLGLYGSDSAPSWLSGLTPDGRPVHGDHLAYLALPDVGHTHAEGDIKGLALAVPRTIPRRAVAEVLERLFPRDASGAIEPLDLHIGRSGALSLAPDDYSRLFALQPRTWLGPAQVWASVTPVVLDRFPKHDGDAEAGVAVACARIGLPHPIAIEVLSGSPFIGAPPAQRMPPLPAQFGRSIRQQTHVRVVFPRSVRGPVALGAGRYRGYGLCRPVAEGEQR